jgi:riboflavin biosynthesis pyrimidine reductase
MPPVSFTRLFPAPYGHAVTDQMLLAGLAANRDAPGDRPHVSVNFVASADGRAAFQGRSGALGDAGDKAIFHGLREQADAVLAGVGTLAAERYGRILRRPERRERRLAAGRAAEPLACVFSRSGRLPLDIPLFAEPEQRVAVFVQSEPDGVEAVAADLTVHRLAADDEHPLRTAMGVLRHEHGIRILLCEGGPILFGALLAEGLVDELFLTISPQLAGGESGPSITAGAPLDELAPLALEWVLEREGTLYVRYRLADMGQSRR